jgi:mRNA interferase YafQ
MKLKVEFTAKFKKDLKLAQKRNLDTDKIFDVIEKLSNKHDLDPKFRDHQLINYGTIKILENAILNLIGY